MEVSGFEPESKKATLKTSTSLVNLFKSRLTSLSINKQKQGKDQKFRPEV